MIGSLLPWAKVTAGSVSQTATGIDGWEGKATILFGALVVIGGIAAFAARGRPGVVIGPAAALLGGLVCGVVTGYDMLTLKTQAITAAADEISRSTGLSVVQAKAQLQLRLDSGVLNVVLAYAIVVVFVGAVLAMVGSIIALIRGRRPAVTAPGFDAATFGPGFPPPWSAQPPPAPGPPPPAPSGPPPAEPGRTWSDEHPP